MITQSQLKEQLHYDSTTGIFTRLVSPNGKNKVGEIAGTVDKNGYVGVSILSKTYKAHRLAWLYVQGEHLSKKQHIDHIDGNRLNNSIHNLRKTDACGNMKNKTRPKHNTSGKIGVKRKGNRWEATITVNKKRIYLGSSKNLDKVIKLRQDAEILYGFTSREEAQDSSKELEVYNSREFYRRPKERTKNTLLRDIYFNQRSNSKKRGMRMPEYTLDEFVEWSMSQTKFHELFNEWKQSGEEKRLIPSVDRRVDAIHYCFGNIQWMTFGENEAKYKLSKVNGTTTKSDCTTVLQIDKETGEVVSSYHSQAEASRVTGINQATISRSCNDNSKTAGGYIWIKQGEEAMENKEKQNGGVLWH